MTVLWVALGAAIGAPLRYLADRWLQKPDDGPFPRGTLLVNVLGSLLLGLIASLVLAGDVGSSVVALGGTGFCGALTTYSTFGYETVRLSERGARGLALSYVFVSVGAGLAAATLGWWVGTVLS